MIYLPRRLSITGPDGMKEISQEEFLRLEGPLVVIGEPGVGKSEFVRQVKEREQSKFYSASGVLSYPVAIASNTALWVIIDALDEVTAYSPGAPIVSILSRIV